MAAKPLFGLDLGQLRHMSAKDLLVRFAFGAAISIVAGIGGNIFGYVIGGLLLAFPAILPATLTLLEHREGNAAASPRRRRRDLRRRWTCSFRAVVATTALGHVPAWGAPR
jgi:hypothetical protein